MKTLNMFISTTLLLLSMSAATAGSAPAFKCNPNGNQPEINQCAADDYAAADKKLNLAWQRLLSAHKHEGNINGLLKKAQKAWMAFRDAEVAAMFACDEGASGSCFGSMYNTSYHQAMTELTNARTQRLVEYFDKGLSPSLGN